MRRLFALFVVFSAAGVLMSAGLFDEADTSDSAVQQKLIQMERDWANAMMNNDSAVIERIEADDYSYMMDDMKGGKQGDVDQAKNHAYAGTAELSDMQARVFGDAGIVSGKASLRNAKYNGKDVSGDYLFTDVFVKRNGQWRVVASHSNRTRRD